MATLGELLNSGTARLRKAGSASARLDAELLLGWAIGAERTALLAHPEAGRTPPPRSKERWFGARPANPWRISGA